MYKHFRTGTPLKSVCCNNIRGQAGIPGAQGITGIVTLLRSVTPDVNRCMTNEDRSTSSQVKSNPFQHLPEIRFSRAQQSAQSFRELGRLLHIPPPPHQQKITICKGRNPWLFSVPLHALTNSLAMFPSSQAGRKNKKQPEEASGMRQPERCCCQRGPLFVEHPLAFLPGDAVAMATGGCSLAEPNPSCSRC